MESLIYIVGFVALLVLALVLRQNPDTGAAGPLMDRTLPGQEGGEPVAIAKDSESFGIGCLIQLVGLTLPIIGFALGAMLGSALANRTVGSLSLVLGASGGMIGGVAGVLAMLALLVVGSKKARLWRCSNCMNRVIDKRVRLCPTCHAPLKPPASITDGF